MSKTRRINYQLEELYKTLPTIQCKGLCQECCGPIAMSKAEYTRITRSVETKPTVDNEGTCSLLVEGRCSVYSIRPMLCRLWGVTRTMECPHGCEPSRWLTREEGFEFLGKVEKIVGSIEIRATIKELEDYLQACGKGISSLLQTQKKVM